MCGLHLEMQCKQSKAKQSKAKQAKQSKPARGTLVLKTYLEPCKLADDPDPRLSAGGGSDPQGMSSTPASGLVSTPSQEPDSEASSEPSPSLRVVAALTLHLSFSLLKLTTASQENK